ncbi:MAG: hypothetical protein DMG91_15840, partial [Acidobacteria bacterium]
MGGFQLSYAARQLKLVLFSRISSIRRIQFSEFNLHVCFQLVVLYYGRGQLPFRESSEFNLTISRRDLEALKTLKLMKMMVKESVGRLQMKNR